LKTPKEEKHLGSLGVSERVLLSFILKQCVTVWATFIGIRIGFSGQALVNTVIKFGLYKRRKIFLTSPAIISLPRGTLFLGVA
jgi:hypothetical protein